MSDHKEIKPVETSDKELDDLLTSALEDFDKKKDETKEVKTNSVATEELWNEEFLAHSKVFEEKMASFFGNEGISDGPTPDQLSLGLRKMAEAAMLASEGEGFDNVDPKYSESITQAIKGLKEGSDTLATVVPPEEIANMFAGMQLNEGDSDANPFMPFVQGMMQSLLSAEVLLPSLKELLEKYPSWLAENNDKIDAADKERYIKQQELFKVICTDLEEERPEDSADVKDARFKKVLKHMQQLHEYGQPPVDLVGDAAGATNMDLANSQCSVM